MLKRVFMTHNTHLINVSTTENPAAKIQGVHMFK